MEDIGPTPDEDNDAQPGSSAFDTDNIHTEPPVDEPSGESTLSTLPRWSLAASIGLVTIVIATALYIAASMIWADIGIGVAGKMTGTTGADVPDGYWESLWAGLVLGVSIWVCVGLWRGARHQLDGLLKALLKPPIWIFVGIGVAMLIVLSGLFGGDQDLPIFLSGTIGGYWLVTVVVALPWVVRISWTMARKSYGWLAQRRYRAGVFTGTMFTASMLFAVTAGIGVLLLGAALEEMDDEQSARATDEFAEEAQFMGIFSGDGATEEDEIEARRRDECFNTLGDTSAEIFEQGQWKAYRRLRDEQRAQDAVFRAILKVCEAHGNDEKDNIEAYFHATLQNHLVDLEDRRVREAELCSIDLEGTTGLYPPDQRRQTTDREIFRAVQQAFCSLSSNQQDALQAFALGHSHREIADLLNTSPGNSRQLVSRARDHIRTQTTY